MKRSLGMSVAVGLVVALVGGMVLAAEGGTLRGAFVKRVEKQLGEVGYLGIVVRLAEGRGETTLLVPRRREDLMKAARELREGQTVEVLYGVEEGQKWVRGIEVAREPEARPQEAEELRRMVRQLLERVEKLEAQVKELREQLNKVRGEGAARSDKEAGGREGGEKKDSEKARPEAERTDKPRGEGDRPGAEREKGGEAEADRTGEVRGAFVKLVEKRIGELEYLGVVVRPDGREEAMTLLVPKVRREDRMVNHEELSARARQLREGQRVEIGWRLAEGQRWIQRLAR